MRGHKWKMLEVAMGLEEVTSKEFAVATGLPAPQTSPYAHALEDAGYLKLLREDVPERGGRPKKIYQWTGKKPPRTAGSVFRAVHDRDNPWGKADAVLINCFNSMVKLGSGNGNEMECAL